MMKEKSVQEEVIKFKKFVSNTPPEFGILNSGINSEFVFESSHRK